jgi:glutamyl-tRNA synthetase, bacterial family
MEDLAWLQLTYDEGPIKGGPHAPYYQSERLNLYQEKLDELKNKNLVYRCFCTPEELEKKRDRQIALKMPPRYDRTCARLSPETITQNINASIPFIWRFKVDHAKTITIQDIARGTVTFDLQHFSDFPLSRADGSFTFIFANFVDDIMMEITHIFRGEDHQSNTACQIPLYEAFNKPVPIFWHVPMLCNVDGKKLSKRDFGFSLHDLKSAGFLPEAINNYLSIIGGSFKQEIMSLEELTTTFNFDTQHHTGNIKYDVEKLRWVNHQWIQRLSPDALTTAILPFLVEKFPQAASIDRAQLQAIIQILKTDLYTLADAQTALAFYFQQPIVSSAAIEACSTPEHLPLLTSIITKNLVSIENSTDFLDTVKAQAKEAGIPMKQLFWVLRLLLTGHTNGPSIAELLTILGAQESKKRISCINNRG